MKKVLIITYYWPPSGGSGVQRWLKFSKYLPEFGVEPIILTVDPEFATYPSIDVSLKDEIDQGIKVYRTKAKNPLDIYQTIRRKQAPQSGFSGEKKVGFLDKVFRFIRGNVFLPDARIGWNPYAYEKAKKLIKEFNIDTIITTSPPHSTQLLGLRLKKDFQIKWIADLRDPWTEIFYNKQLFRTKWAERQDAKMEKMCLELADEVVVVSQSIADSFIQKYPTILGKMNVIANGYDDKDFVGLVKRPNQNKRISYVGNLGSQYPIDDFLISFSSLVKQDSTWKMQFIGNCDGRVQKMIGDLNLEKNVEFVPYVPHKEAIQFMKDATLLLLIIPNVAENKGILTGKLFEYMATGNPIIFIGPNDGDAATILKEYGPVFFGIPANEARLNEELSKMSSPTIQNKFSRRELTKQIIQLFS